MKKFGLLSTSAIGSAAFFGMSLALAAPASAQVTDADAPCTPEQAEAGICTLDTDTTTTSSSNVLVTGSRIRRPNIESNVPIVSVTAEDLTAQGDVNIGDALNDLPSLRSTFSQANSTRFIGTAGVNVLDLRGLGTSRTLVLVNGRRHITYTPGDFLVDVNTIPTDLVERVDVITGGSSAVYGSDAVAGVVNFVLRRDFDGIRLRGQGGVSQQGDRAIQFVSLTAGRNFMDDRANIAINLEYVNAEALYFADRPGLTGAVDGRCQFNLQDVTGGEPGGTDNVPDQLFFCNIRNINISNGGTVPALSPTVGANTGCTNATFGPGGINAVIGAQRCINPGTPQGQVRIFRFNAAGQLIQDIPAFDFRPFASGNYIASPLQDPNAIGSTLRDTGQLAPGLDRYTANILAHFDISDAFRPFIEAKYVHIFARQEGQPSFFQGVASTIGAPDVRCNNAFLSAAALAQLQAVGRCANPATGTFPLARFNVDFGGRSELVTRDTYRVVAGVQGDFNDDWNYEVSFNYGHVKTHQDELNDLILTNTAGTEFDGFLLAYDSVLVAGVPTCRVNADSDPANNRPDCIPINLFGVGRPSAAALDFINTTSFVDSRASQYNAVAFVNGDLSQAFEFPGGPARFVLGAEWRRETAFQVADELSSNFGTFFNAFPTFDPPTLEILEAFGELELPLLRDLPFAQELTVTGAARYSDYNEGAGSAGSSFAYNINGTWAPVRDIRFRANYSQAVRVPTLTDLFTPETQTFAFVQDPCDVNFIGNNPNRPGNCALLGVPVGFINTVARAQTIGLFAAGNEDIEEETGKSLTIGAVITPRWIPGLSITVDYYRIRVNSLIAAPSAQAILNGCTDIAANDISNQFCQQIFPRQPSGLLQPIALISRPLNFAQFQADGIDMEVSYRRTFDNGHRLSARAIATYVIRRNNFVSPQDPNFADRILGELGDPQWAANFNVTYGIGPWDLRYSANYIGVQYVGAFENYFSFQGRPPLNPDNALPIRYPDVVYHAVRLNHRVNERFQFYMGIDNVFDTEPPLGLLGTAGGDPFDSIGRYFYAGAQVDF